MTDGDKPRRPLGLGGYAASIGITVVVAAFAGIGSALFGDQPGLVGLLVKGGMISAAMAVGFVACLWWWRGIDEAAREAHKWAWWWGGSGGMAAAGVVFLALGWHEGAEPVIFKPGTDPFGIMMVVLLFQLAGYVLAWAVWWLRRR